MGKPINKMSINVIQLWRKGLGGKQLGMVIETQYLSLAYIFSLLISTIPYILRTIYLQYFDRNFNYF